MIEIINIDSLEQPELYAYRTLKQPVEHFKQGIFIAEGNKVVEKLLASSFQIISALTTPEWFDKFKTSFEHHHSNIKIFIANKSLLEKIVGYNLHQCIMALAKIPQQTSLEEFLSTSKKPRLLVAIEGLTNAENIGVLVRNCVAFGVDAIIVGENSSSPYLRRAVRNSMGAIFKIPVFHVDNLINCINKLHADNNFLIIGAHPHTENTILHNINFKQDVCLIFGSEGYGLSDKILNSCNLLASIYMHNTIDSLNVANACGIFLYEASKQRLNK